MAHFPEEHLHTCCPSPGLDIFRWFLNYPDPWDLLCYFNSKTHPRLPITVSGRATWEFPSHSPLSLARCLCPFSLPRHSFMFYSWGKFKSALTSLRRPCTKWCDISCCFERHFPGTRMSPLLCHWSLPWTGPAYKKLLVSFQLNEWAGLCCSSAKIIDLKKISHSAPRQKAGLLEVDR